MEPLTITKRMKAPVPYSEPLQNQLNQRLVEKILKEYVIRTDELSPRENFIAFCLAQSVPPEKIAEWLFISPETVITHRKSIYAKLNVHSHTELFCWYIHNVSKPFKKV